LMSFITGTLALFLGGLIGLSIFVGCASRPPTRFEQGLFNIETNQIPIVVLRTNIFDVTVVRTNAVTVTNTVGVVEWQTNIIPVVVQQTNTMIVTNTQEAYLYHPGEGAKNIQEVGTTVGNLFGVGGMTGTALGALFSLWGYWRSKKSLVTAGNIAQTVETMREFVKSLPNGATYDNELVNWMQAHQADAGVLNQVMTLLKTQVNNQDAKVAAQQVMDTINALKNLAPTPPQS